jgi:hypothetical protein
MIATPTSALDPDVVAQAEQVIRSAISDVLANAGDRRAVVVKAPAGAGKSYFVGTAVGELRKAGARVAVAAPTNEQIFGLVELLGRRHPHETIKAVLASGRTLPPSANLPNVASVRTDEALSANVLVGTLAKFGYSPDSFGSFDVLVIDEAYQADAGRYYEVGGIAPTHLLVGDSGQLDPFSTMDNADRWRGLPEDPLQTAVGVLLRNHPETTVHKMPVSRRLDPRAVEIVRSFYPGHSFDAAVRSGVRRLRLDRADGDSMEDFVLDLAADGGWAHLELPQADVLTADPVTIDRIVALVRRLVARRPAYADEASSEPKPLPLSQIAVGVSHNDQKDYLRAALDQAHLNDVVVNTANKLQGLQYEVVIVWHPLAGLPDPDGFHLDPGRLCVLLSRHRQMCIVVGRESDRALVAGLPPSTPAYLGWDPDPVLDGWAVHQAVFDGLSAHRVEAAEWDSHS